MEGLLHLYANQLNLGQTIYVMNHYTAGVILFGEGEEVRKHSLRGVMLVFIPLICSDLQKTILI